MKLLFVWVMLVGAVWGQGELLFGGAADPTTVAGRNGDSGYYTVATGKGARILHSENLKEWKVVGRVFSERVPGWASETVPKNHGIWAPDISFHNGLYHLCITSSCRGTTAVGGRRVTTRWRWGGRGR